MTMQCYRDGDGNVHGFDDTDSSQVALMNSLVSGWTCVTGAWPPAETDTEKWATYQALAKTALATSDTSMLRIHEAVILGATTMDAPDVVAFVKWRQALRAILAEAQPGEIPDGLPAMPPYPQGTGTTV